MSIESTVDYSDFLEPEVEPPMPELPHEQWSMDLIEADYRLKARRRQSFVGSNYGMSGAYSPEDVIQESFTNAIAARAKLTNENVSPWLWTITRNAATDYLRKQTRSYPTDPIQVNDHMDQAVASETGSHTGQQVEVDALLETLREHVPNDDVYETFELYAKDGLRQVDIAFKLGLPLTTIKQRILRVRRTARQLIDDGILEF